MLMLLWICATSGTADAILRSMAAGLTGSVTSTAQTPGGAVAAPTGSVSLAVAKQRFREISPDLYARAADLNSPSVRVEGDLTTFTWHYIQRLSNRSVKAVPFVLVVTSGGTVRSVSTGQ
jgi:hypothetical protein